MNAVNRFVTAVFDVLLTPLEVLGPEFALVVVSGLFGVGALFIFKFISNQKGIKAAKDKIKGHMIEIRIYQDDLGLVSKAIGKVMLRNLQYVTYNLLPFVPLAIPFVFVLAQFVTRYGFAPLPVETRQVGLLAGSGTNFELEFAEGRWADAAGLTIEYPDFIRPLTKVVRAPSEGRAFQEIVATGPGRGAATITLADGTRLTKEIVAGGEAPRMMQGDRVSGLSAALWPAEESLGSDSPVEHVWFVYPDAPLRWMPDGAFGVIVAFLIASIVFGLAAMKPLKVQI
jgi:hypothetical protein